jgi:hypothetical protein
MVSGHNAQGFDGARVFPILLGSWVDLSARKKDKDCVIFDPTKLSFVGGLSLEPFSVRLDRCRPKR